MTEFKETELDERAIKMAKVLSADAVERAGHDQWFVCGVRGRQQTDARR